jgi:hypothetical protein
LWLAEFSLSFLLLIALLLSLFSTRSRYLLAVVVLTSFLVLLDVTRLQPWVYQYVLMITTFSFSRMRRAELNKETTIATIIASNQIIVASLYFWSGVQKLNWTFAHEVLPGLLEDAGLDLHSSLTLSRLAIAIALIEALTGVGLLVRRSRQIAVVLAVALHLSVLVLLILARRNTVVWPWNLAMLSIVPILFWRIGDSPARKELWRWRKSDAVNYLPKAVVVLCVLAPAFSFAGWWDLYLSGALYAGNAPVGVVRINDQVRAQISEIAKEQIFTSSRSQLMLPLPQWSEVELNVPPYPEVRAYRQLTLQICTMTNNSEGIELIIKSRPYLRDGSYTVKRDNCQTLTGSPYASQDIRPMSRQRERTAR